MLTENEFRFISGLFQISFLLHSNPFDWDNVNSQLFETKSKFKLFVSRVMIIWKICYTATVLLRFHPLTSWNNCDRTIVKQMFQSILCVSYIAVCTEGATFHFYSREASSLFNQLTLFNRNQGKNLLTSDTEIHVQQ